MQYTPELYSTIFSLLPPVIAIVLALITKEVYSSLFLGIVTGALLYANGNPLKAWNAMLYNESGGLVPNLTDISHIGILVFVILLGTFVVLMKRSGSAEAFAKFAGKHIKTRVGAQLAAIFMGILIFVDDGFNCMTVGTVMRPITDKFKISRAKLAYLIDSTAAPICIIAPISSWGAAVSYSVPEDLEINGFVTFLRTIPYNFYAICTLAVLFIFTIKNINLGKMAIEEAKALEMDDNLESSDNNSKGKTSNLVIPVIILIISCITFMMYTGGFFKGESIINSFANAESAKALVMGSLLSIIITFIIYKVRKVIPFKVFMESFAEGFRTMCAPMIILVLAWNLSGMTNLLGAGEFIKEVMGSSAGYITMFVPVIVFVISVLLAFSTGTSWGTFTILIPILCNIFTVDNELLVISMAACLSGAVCGDHCSPISDTTIMSSAGAECDHITHVYTQLPYAIYTAVISAIGYLIAGIIGYYFNNFLAILGLIVSIILIYITMPIIKRKLAS